jgi:hypothetical protein
VESTDTVDVRGQDAQLVQHSNVADDEWAKAIRGKLDATIAVKKQQQQQQQNKKKPYPLDDGKKYTKEEFQRFLDYDCNYKKHKGKKWGTVLHTDPAYFTWVLTKAMSPRLKTWKVFSMILTDEERATAIKHSLEKKEHTFAPREKRPRQPEEEEEEEKPAFVHPRMANVPEPTPLVRQ